MSALERELEAELNAELADDAGGEEGWKDDDCSIELEFSDDD